MEHCKPGNFIVLDIDETLLIHGFYPCMLLTPQGVRTFSDAMKKNKDMADIREVRQVFQESLMQRRLVEKNTALIVKKFQDVGCKVFGLTSRYSETAVATREELMKHGIDMSIASPFPNSHLLNDPITKAACQDGIIFSNGTPKGPVLNRFLEGFVFHSLYKEALANGGKISDLRSRVPNQIIFVDDREQNCLSVHHSLRSAVTFGIQLVTYHYTRVSYAEYHSHRPMSDEDGVEEPPCFDYGLMNKQLQHLFSHKVILDDDAARKLLGGEQSTRLHGKGSLAVIGR